MLHLYQAENLIYMPPYLQPPAAEKQDFCFGGTVDPSETFVETKEDLGPKLTAEA